MTFNFSYLRKLSFLIFISIVSSCCIINKGSDSGDLPKNSTVLLSQEDWLKKTKYSGIYCLDSVGNPYVCNQLIVNLENYTGDIDSLKAALGVISSKNCYSCVETDIELWDFDLNEIGGNIENGKTASVKAGGLEEVEKNYIGANLQTEFENASFSLTKGRSLEGCENLIIILNQLNELNTSNPESVTNFYNRLREINQIEGNEETIIDQLNSLNISSELTSNLFSDEQSRECFNQYFLTYKGMPRQNGLLIGIIDSGFDYDYPFDNSFPKGGFSLLSAKCTGVSYDFVEEDDFPDDDHGHGTHVAGIIIQELKNTGIDYQILPIKSHDKDGASTMFDNLCAVEAAILNQVDIVNMSFGWESVESDLFKKAMDKLDNAGIIVVTSAGNLYKSNDDYPHYPSDYQLGNIISVAAYDPYRKTLVNEVSNYGKREVDVAANGFNILSIVPTTSNRPVFQEKTGTSMAAPYLLSQLIISNSCYKTLNDPDYNFSSTNPLPHSLQKINNRLMDSIIQGHNISQKLTCP